MNGYSAGITGDKEHKKEFLIFTANNEAATTSTTTSQCIKEKNGETVCKCLLGYKNVGTKTHLNCQMEKSEFFCWDFMPLRTFQKNKHNNSISYVPIVLRRIR